MQDETPPRVGLAALWMTGAIASFSAMAVAGREVSATLDTFEIMTYRSLLGFFVVVGVLTATGKLRQLSTRDLGLQGLRNLVHFSGQNLWFFAVTAIPLAQVFALEFTSPLWVVVLAPLVLGERLTPTRALSAVIGFTGILIVTRPSPETLSLGVFAAAGTAVFFAFTNMLTKKLTRRHSVGNILFWLTLLQLIFGVVAAGSDGNITLPNAQTAPYLVVIALSGLLAHFCIANALTKAPAAVVMPLEFARLPVIAVLGMFLYAEPLEVWVFAGAAVIFAGNYLNIHAETRKIRVA